MLAAAARAAHLIVDSPPYVFADDWAARLLGDRADELIEYHRRHGDHLVLAGARAQAVIRSRVTEDLLAASGIDQYVVLGAGLDSFACRAAAARHRLTATGHIDSGAREHIATEGGGHDDAAARPWRAHREAEQGRPGGGHDDAAARPWRAHREAEQRRPGGGHDGRLSQKDRPGFAAESATRVRVFEVDHPDSQAAKRDRLHALGVPADAASFVPVDLERESPVDALCGAGLDLSRPVFVSWLGVTMYLTRAAVGRAIGDLRALPPGSHLVLDHMVPAEMRDPAAQAYVDLVAPNTADRGEPWLSFFTPDDMAAELSVFGATTSISQHDVLNRPRTDALRPARLTLIAHAVRREP